MHTEDGIVLTCILQHNLLPKYIPIDNKVDDKENKEDRYSDDEIEYVTPIGISYN